MQGRVLIDDNLPVYIISSAADLLGLHPRTLHLYEEKGLVVPVRKGNRRFYSANDLQWIHAIRFLVHQRGINLEGLRQVLALRAQLAYQSLAQHLSPGCMRYVGPTAPCWERGMTQLKCHACPVYRGARTDLQKDQDVPLLPT